MRCDGDFRDAFSIIVFEERDSAARDAFALKALVARGILRAGRGRDAAKHLPLDSPRLGAAPGMDSGADGRSAYVWNRRLHGA